MSDSIYIRNDHQCLAAYIEGQIYHLAKDPLLKETYHSIVLNDKLIYFIDLVANRELVKEPIGIAIVDSYLKLMKEVREEKVADYDVSLDYLYFLLGQTELLDGRNLTNEPLSIKGIYLIELLEKTDLDLSRFIYIAPEHKYPIPSTYIQDGYTHLSPENVEEIVELSNRASSFLG
jgi:hypothetical protein